jgi:Zn-dependent protease
MSYPRALMSTVGAARRATTAFEFRLLGIRVSVQWSFFAVILVPLAAGRSLAGAALWLSLAFVSVLVHELGHARIARRFGATPTIDLVWLGGLTHAQCSQWTRAQELAFVLAGPIASLALGAVALAADCIIPADRSELTHTVISDLRFMGFGWGLINLIPMLPLDGSRVARILLGRRDRDPITGFDIGASALVLIAVTMALYPTELLAAKPLLFNLATLLWYHSTLLRAWRETHVDERHEQALRSLELPLALDDCDARVAAGEALLAKLRSRTGRWRALQVIAKAHHDARRYREAAEAIDRLPQGSWANVRLTVTSFVHSGQARRAVAFARERLEAEDHPYTRRLLLWSLTHAEMIDEALQVDPAQLDDGAHPVCQELTDALFRRGRYADAAQWLVASLARFGHVDDAYNLACAFARTGRHEQAVHWLRTAIDRGYRNRAHLEQDEDLASIRGRADVQAMIEQMSTAPSVTVTPLIVKTDNAR